MSRYELDGRKPGFRVVVGWDQPMLTYFVHVFDPASKREGPTVWLGGTPSELYELDDLKRAIRPHADLTLQLFAQLYRDRDEGR
ncbi:hypothetical protein [Beijerinckia sp. L45]|uniref:hypothetical protein n=1 Tax=Beijerinckia sp. L45 TaxID=1641855 RepID=UPI00131C80D7|nr:hypothetical protein [Beijerinckia sp. L45]